jgi:dienelactone hydrolase
MNRVFAMMLLSLLMGCASNGARPNATKSTGAVVSQTEILASRNRAITTEILLPKEPGAYPLVLFSHGAFASHERYRKLLSPIASAGYIVVAPVHRDSEALQLKIKASPETVWATRNEDIAVMADAPVLLREALQTSGYRFKGTSTGVIGHSYGALIAQLAAGAKQRFSDGRTVQYRHAAVGAVIAFSPPGQAPANLPQTDWSNITVPSLVITGTADVLPGFIDDWRDHLISYNAQEAGEKWLWIGSGIDHYFGGVFGRERPVSDADQNKFNHALSMTIQFLDCQLKDLRCNEQTKPLRGIQLVRD